MSSNPFVAILDPSTGNVGTVSATGEMSVKFLSTPAVTITPTTSATATLTSVASSATTVVLLASNASRKGAILQNGSTKTLFIAYAATASLVIYTDEVLAGNTWEMSGTGIPYTGVISGIWSAVNGTAHLTELT